jgi:hypothetical protein
MNSSVASLNKLFIPDCLTVRLRAQQGRSPAAEAGAR